MSMDVVFVYINITCISFWDLPFVDECKVKFHAAHIFTVISLCKTICEFLMRLTLQIIAGNTMPTFPKFNMETNNDTLEKEILFGNHPFQVRCQTSGGYSDI